jgi:hypothetical protein
VTTSQFISEKRLNVYAHPCIGTYFISETSRVFPCYYVDLQVFVPGPDFSSAGATGGAMDASNLLKPMLGRGELRCIGATTLDEYRKYIEKDAALERRFQQVYCGEPEVEDTVSILRGLRERYELHHGVKISDGALVAAAVLSDRYITGRFLPDKGIACTILWNYNWERGFNSLFILYNFLFTCSY